MLKIICLKGGVGNQLFEFCRFCQLKNEGHHVYIHYDRRRLKQHNGQRLDQIFRVSLPAEPVWVTVSVAILKVLRMLRCARRLYDDERDDCLLIDDYCQRRSSTLNARQVLKFRDDLLTDEAWREARSIREAAHAVAIHVRRGDYLHASNIHDFGTCSLAYYASAMDKIRERYGKAQFFLFSDDVAWCREQPLFADCRIVELRQSPDYVSLYLMTLCRSHVIANSTFSFWGAFLSTDDNGMNIYPRRWYANETWNNPDFLPSSWIAVD